MSLAPNHSWYLEGFIDERRETWRTPVAAFPFRIGRQEGASLRLASPEVSSQHAELESRHGDLWIRDLGSKNGSYVNGLQVNGETRLRSGDVVRFATWEFRLVGDGAPSKTITQTLVLSAPAGSLVKMMSDLRDILDQERVTAYFQPIVSFQDDSIVAYEALGRGLHPAGTVVSPGQLFELAAGLRREGRLSALFRQKAMDEAQKLASALPKEDRPVVFVNTHPAELQDGVADLLASLETLSARSPWARIVLEIHEAAIANGDVLMELSRGLGDIDVDLAFDDFGTGQARLLELLDVAPKYLKFDRAWISGVHEATEMRLEMLSRLVTMVSDLGVATLAEGVEHQEEAEVCRQLGFDMAQGYHFGRPAPVESLRAEDD